MVGHEPTASHHQSTKSTVDASCSAGAVHERSLPQRATPAKIISSTSRDVFLQPKSVGTEILAGPSLLGQKRPPPSRIHSGKYEVSHRLHLTLIILFGPFPV